ncbi:hypothetical protein N7466_002082 [Penicillium verhagenii]|uniref:uncharacterized protein n=1 Tax=Penicillium verhagenii TaxID=1562060 RepID=UPI002544ED50|nr:uncharacterized protein N7466_002082 [Penicillium verhagenii]KAJ5938948.1 hypothetical protein N7466_002082 [Penicillium verhagenii]
MIWSFAWGGSKTKLVLVLQGSAEAGLSAGGLMTSPDLDTEVEQRTQGIHESPARKERRMRKVGSELLRGEQQGQKGGKRLSADP